MPYACIPWRWLAMLAGVAAIPLIWLLSGPQDCLSSAEGPLAGRVCQTGNRRAPTGSTAAAVGDGGALAAACRERAAWAAGQLGPSCSVIIREPFVLGGDLSAAQLDRCCSETIRPAAEAMARAYLAARPDRPITLLLFAGETSYRRHVRGLFGDKEPPRFGSYRPHLRAVTLNLDTGAGTITHELTHALVDLDFPDIPAWLNEGLASLHEQCRITDSSSPPEGLVNWRLPVLLAAIQEGRLRPLKSLLSSDDFHGCQESLNYAHARYLCLYLQQRGALQGLYRRLRDGIAADPTGLATLVSMFPGRSAEQLDADFRHWAVQLKR